MEVDGVITNYTPDDLNQYDQISGPTTTSPNYDDDGNLISDGTTNYFWDAENRL